MKLHFLLSELLMIYLIYNFPLDTAAEWLCNVQNNTSSDITITDTFKAPNFVLEFKCQALLYKILMFLHFLNLPLHLYKAGYVLVCPEPCNIQRICSQQPYSRLDYYITGNLLYTGTF